MVPALKNRKILVVDDDPLNRELLVEAFTREECEVQEAESGTKALAILEIWAADLVLLDHDMPGLSGLETLRQIRKRRIPSDVVFISAHGGSIVTEALDAGANDYIKKPFSFGELLARVRVRFRLNDLYGELESANQRLYELSLHDDLTGLLNMRSMYDRIDHELARARRGTGYVSAIMMDMDYFKSVNDGHDHLFGSFVLKEVGRILKGMMRECDFAARYGGDEFLIVLTDTDELGTRTFCDRFLETMRSHVFSDGQDTISLTSSLGYSVSSHSGHIDARELVRTADHALYEAKEGGRNRRFGYGPDETATKTQDDRRRRKAA